MRRPVPVATLSALFLIVLGLPFLGIKFNTVDPTVLPESASARQAYDTVSAEFPPYRETPIWVDVEGGGPQARRDGRRRGSSGSPGVAEVLPPQPPARTASPRSRRSRPTRSSPRPARSTVEGDPRPAERRPGRRSWSAAPRADFVDFQSSLAEHLPIALAIIVVATLVILFLMTGSVVLPIKSLIMNFLNLSAVFGLLVLIFQDGRLEGFLDYSSPGAIEQTMPILLFAVAFGLSTDYAVFLLSRIKEARDNGASDSRVRGDRAGADRADRHRRGAAVRGRDGRLRHLADHLHQGERGRHGARGPDRRQHRPRPAGPLADGAARQVELVGAGAAAAPARADRDQRERPPAPAPREVRRRDLQGDCAGARDARSSRRSAAATGRRRRATWPTMSTTSSPATMRWAASATRARRWSAGSNASIGLLGQGRQRPRLPRHREGDRAAANDGGGRH